MSVETSNGVILRRPRFQGAAQRRAYQRSYAVGWVHSDCLHCGKVGRLGHVAGRTSLACQIVTRATVRKNLRRLLACTCYSTVPIVAQATRGLDLVKDEAPRALTKTAFLPCHCAGEWVTLPDRRLPNSGNLPVPAGFFPETRQSDCPLPAVPPVGHYGGIARQEV
jgi:hypothetical protein